MRTLASVEIKIMLVFGLPCCLSSSSVRCLESDPYEAIRQAYLVGTDTQSKPFEGEAETPESPHIVAPPTCHVEESEGSGTSGVRSTSSNSTASLSPDHPLTHTTPALVPILRRTARMAVSVSPAMSPGISVGIAEVAAMSDSAFRKSEEDKEVEESLDVDSESEDVEDEGPTAEDRDPTAGDKGLVARDGGPGMRVKSHSLDDEAHRLESDGLGLGEEEEAVPEGQQQAAPVMGTAVSAPLGLGTICSDTATPEWSPGSFPISLAPSIIPSPIPSPMISLTVPSPIASLVVTSTATIPVDEDRFIERYRFRSLKHEQERTSVTFEALWRPMLALEAWTGHVDNRMTDTLRVGYDDHRLVHDMLLQQAALQRELQEMRGRVTVLEQERDRKERGANRKTIDREWSWGILERVVVIELET
nr:hypothetical protein [Tanacetum cinerariifolium]